MNIEECKKVVEDMTTPACEFQKHKQALRVSNSFARGGLQRL